MSHWNQLSQFVLESATNRAFQLPPIQHDASFVRLALALAELCHLVYLRSQDEISSQPHFDVPVQSPHGLPGDHSVQARLHHFRQAGTGRELASSQQFAVWEVGELGIVLAFRGTASFEDAIVDIAMTPVPLQLPRGRTDPHINVHGGFYKGVLAIVDEACAALKAATRRRRDLPVWFTGHSLGGGYASALFVHLLALRQLPTLFHAGGGVMTFGAPMVLHSLDPAQLYASLRQLSARHSSGLELHIHHIVNNADVVPRLLGPQLDSMYQAVHAMVPSIQGVRDTARQYLPIGSFHVILGSTLRSIPAASSQASGAAGPAGPAGPAGESHSSERASLGSEEEAAAVGAMLGAGQIWKSIYASGRGGAMQHHSMLLYIRHLRAHTAALAAESAARAEAAAAGGFQQELLLFSACPAEAPEQTPFHRLGEAAGDYSAALMSQAGSYLYSSAGDWWQHYWSKPADQPGAAASSTEQRPQQQPGSDGQAETRPASGWSSYLPSFRRQRQSNDSGEL